MEKQKQFTAIEDIVCLNCKQLTINENETVFARKSETKRNVVVLECKKCNKRFEAYFFQNSDNVRQIKNLTNKNLSSDKVYQFKSLKSIDKAEIIKTIKQCLLQSHNVQEFCERLKENDMKVVLTDGIPKSVTVGKWRFIFSKINIRFDKFFVSKDI